MWHVLGSTVDVLHALAMAAWVIGLPLLFSKRLPRWRVGYALYAIGFIAANQISHLALGECFMTTLARLCWERAAPGSTAATDEWFTVRLAQAVFRMTPSHKSLKLLGEVLILTTAVGALVSLRSRAPRPA